MRRDYDRGRRIGQSSLYVRNPAQAHEPN
jgi:hypothetical protein